MYNKKSDNDGKHINRIIQKIPCLSHHVSREVPCYIIVPGATTGADVLFGICGNRIKAYGYNGKVTTKPASKTA